MLNINMMNLIAPCFYETFWDVLDHGNDTYVECGGRGSTKSSAVSTIIIYLMLILPFACAVVIMKHQNKLRKGVFNQFLLTLSRMGISQYFKVNYSTMVITYKPTGQFIQFIGLDDPQKTKSLNTGSKKLQFAISWFEELDQFSGIGEIDTALESIIRGCDKHWTFMTFNPPENRNNWCNRWILKDIPGRRVNRTDYRMVPQDWLKEGFYTKMRTLRLRSEREYRWRYLGEATGVGGSVFENIRDIILTPDMLYNFDNHYNGQDWGYFPDPAAFVRWHFDKSTDSLYAVAESIKTKSSYSEVAQNIIQNGYNDVCTILDSARGDEMLSAFKKEGVYCSNMYKGRNGQLSREFGIQWLQTRKNIYIDKKLTPNIYEEFVSYEYQKDFPYIYIIHQQRIKAYGQ